MSEYNWTECYGVIEKSEDGVNSRIVTRKQMNKDYIASEYRRLHAANKFGGGCLKKYLPEIRDLIKQHDCKTILDYGCGKAAHHGRKGLGEVTLYDPYYEPYSKKPTGVFDVVICTDVMEHIPVDQVPQTIINLINYTEKVLFLAICTKPAIKTFGNGENVHLTVQPPEWWNNIIDSANHKGIKIVRHYT